MQFKNRHPLFITITEKIIYQFYEYKTDISIIKNISNNRYIFIFSKGRKIMSYFDTLPYELLNSLFSQLSYYHSLIFLRNTYDLPEFKRLYFNESFWKEQWKQRISSFLDPPQNYKEVYEMYKAIVYCIGHPEKFAEKGYDILLYEALPKNANEYHECADPYGPQKPSLCHIFRSAASGGQISIMKYLIEKAVSFNIDLKYNETLPYAIHN